MKSIETNSAVVVMSCDKYEDLWDPFFHFFEKNWPDCPFPVYLATNSKNYKRKNVQLIHSQKFGSWSEESYEVIKQIPYDRFIYLQDDYLILKKVNTAHILSLLSKMINYKADYLRLFPSPGPDKTFVDEELGEISEVAEYRTSLQCAIWNKTTFLSLLKMEENQWQFESNSPMRSESHLFLSVKKQRGHLKNHNYPISYYYLTAVLRGKWRWEAAQICRNEGILLDPKTREIETHFQMRKTQLYEVLPLFLKKVVDYIRSKFITA